MQITPKVLRLTGFADVFPQRCSLIDGNTWDIDGGGGGIPMVLPGTVHGFTLYDNQGLDFNLTVTITKNFVDTALALSLSSGAADRQVFDEDTSISFSAGDWIDYKNPSGIHDRAVSVSMEITAAALLYGIKWPRFVGVSAGGGVVGAAFGNSIPAAYGGIPSAIAGSITAIPGTISRIGILRHASSAGGAWRARIIKNGVLQDGSGGSSDSTFILDDTDGTYGDTAITVDCVPWDRVSILAERLTTGVSATNHYMGVGIAYSPAIAGQTQLCCGDNFHIPTTGTTWKWQGSTQDDATQAHHTAPIGRRGVSFTRFFVKHSGPGGGDVNTHTILKNGTPTALTLAIGTGDELDITGLASFVAGQLITHEVVNGGTPVSSNLHWALGTGSSIVPDVIGQIGPLAWVHWPRFIP